MKMDFQGSLSAECGETRPETSNIWGECYSEMEKENEPWCRTASTAADGILARQWSYWVLRMFSHFERFHISSHDKYILKIHFTQIYVPENYGLVKSRPIFSSESVVRPKN